MLVLNNIEVLYSNVILVLRGISLEVPDGQIVVLLGANGAGKTTTLKAISGLLKTELGEVTRGTILYGDKRIDALDVEDIARMGIIQVIEGRRSFGQLTVEENLRVGMQGRSRNIRDAFDTVYSYFPILKNLRNRISGYLSGGEQQMLVIGRALMGAPKVMLLDEPSLGLAPKLVEQIFQIIRRINIEQKVSILLVEQNALVALSVATQGYVMENGRIVLGGTGDDLKKNEDVKEFYLGLAQGDTKKSYREVKHYRRRKRWLG